MSMGHLWGRGTGESIGDFIGESELLHGTRFAIFGLVKNSRVDGVRAGLEVYIVLYNKHQSRTTCNYPLASIHTILAFFLGTKLCFF